MPIIPWQLQEFEKMYLMMKCEPDPLPNSNDEVAAGRKLHTNEARS